MLSQSCSIQDLWFVFFFFLFFFSISRSPDLQLFENVVRLICNFFCFSNRAFCYSQLELHKHVIKNCDMALQLDPTLLQAYILKGIFLCHFFILWLNSSVSLAFFFFFSCYFPFWSWILDNQGGLLNKKPLK